jgi:hypothetical protein
VAVDDNDAEVVGLSTRRGVLVCVVVVVHAV